MDIHPSVQKVNKSIIPLLHKLPDICLSIGGLFFSSQVEPFEAAYAKVRTKTVQMEERNVYCGAYFTTVLLDKSVC